MTPFDDFCGTEAEPYSPVHEKPPLRKEIEYQGIQHYHPVEFFGGEEALSLRQELDQQKRKHVRLLTMLSKMLKHKRRKCFLKQKKIILKLKTN